MGVRERCRSGEVAINLELRNDLELLRWLVADATPRSTARPTLLFAGGAAPDGVQVQEVTPAGVICSPRLASLQFLSLVLGPAIVAPWAQHGS